MFAPMFVAALFAIVALLGLVAALQPELFVKHFLAEWQREPITNTAALSWTGWVICGFSGVVAILVVIETLISK